MKSGKAKIDKKPHLLRGGKYPVLQQKRDKDSGNSDPMPGFYVSGTSRPRGPSHLQNSHIDSSRVSYGALSGGLRSLGVAFCDYGIAIRHDKDNRYSGFYYADGGSGNRALGECSHKVGKDLGGTGRGSHFNNNFPVSFIVFPGSARLPPTQIPPLSDDDIRAHIKPLLRSLSLADNADELPLLMGFNETPPLTSPQGMSKLAAHRQNRARPRPANYETIVKALRVFGWTPMYTPTYNMALP